MDADLIIYLASLMPDVQGITCAGCPGEVKASAMVERDGKIFCSERCADMHFALMPRISPARVPVPGCEFWDV